MSPITSIRLPVLSGYLERSGAGTTSKCRPASCRDDPPITVDSPLHSRPSLAEVHVGECGSPFTVQDLFRVDSKSRTGLTISLRCANDLRTRKKTLLDLIFRHLFSH